MIFIQASCLTLRGKKTLESQEFFIQVLNLFHFIYSNAKMLILVYENIRFFTFFHQSKCELSVSK